MTESFPEPVEQPDNYDHMFDPNVTDEQAAREAQQYIAGRAAAEAAPVTAEDLDRMAINKAVSTAAAWPKLQEQREKGIDNRIVFPR